MFQDFLWLVVGSPWPALHSLLWMFVVMTLTLSRPVIADGASDSMGMVLQRVNYGVMFKEDANLILTQENWLHTFHIVLPKRVKPTFVSRCSENTSMCHVINNMSMFLHALHVETYHHLSTTLSAIKTLIPQTNLIKNKRKTRSLLPFIGSLSKGLFGTATMDDVNMLAGHINELNRRTSKLALAMEQHGKRLSSFMSLKPKSDMHCNRSATSLRPKFITIAEVAEESQLGFAVGRRLVGDWSATDRGLVAD